MVMRPNLESIVDDVVWPAIPKPSHAMLLALQFQLEYSQWFTVEELASKQLLQAGKLLKFAADTVPYYKKYLPKLMSGGEFQLDWGKWRNIPVLERADIQQSGDELVSLAIPPAHLPTTTGVTSGSTGRPITLLKTPVTQAMWLACNLRDHLWHRRDFSTKLAAIRYTGQTPVLDGQGVRGASWGPATSMFQNAGETVLLDIRHNIADQMKWLEQQQPAYILSYPSNLAALAEYSIENKLTLPNLKEVRTVGEKLSPQLRPLCDSAWGVAVKDIYSAEEIGYMALQCPTGEHYHVQSEHVILEVINDDGKPCKPGEIGRVVVTTLNNFAKPLIRYAIGDYAQVGDPCSCGRGLPVLTAIMGRTRNMFRKPDGSRFWPVMARLPEHYLKQLPTRIQVQYVQKALDWIEIRVATNSAISAEIEACTVEILHKEYQYPFRISFNYMEQIPRTSRNKYEEFLSELES